MTKILNDKNRCIVCCKEFERNILDNPIDMICHHVSYFPEVIAFVHYLCHRKIHDIMTWEDDHGTLMITNDYIGNKMKTHILIDYNQGDSRKYYEMKKQRGLLL